MMIEYKKKGVNYTFPDNALISAINLHTHRTKTTAATKTTSMISHARNRHLIGPSRTSRQRCKKERKNERNLYRLIQNQLIIK
jgi:hypothetical protein